MADAADLRANAERCSRIANGTRNHRLRLLLVSLAREFEEAADSIEAGSRRGREEDGGGSGGRLTRRLGLGGADGQIAQKRGA
jgi:hypothetical protein